MGLGGILAAMAGGFGKGMLKISEEAWREAEKQKHYEFVTKEREAEQTWKSEEAEKARQHETALNRERMAHDIRRSQIAAAASRVKEPSGDKKTFLEYQRSIVALSTAMSELEKAYEGGNMPPEVSKRYKELSDERDRLNSSEEYFRAANAGGVEARSLWKAYGGIEPVSQQSAPHQSSSDEPISKPIPQMVDLSNASASDVEAIYTQKRAEEGKARTQKMVDDSKAWAAQQMKSASPSAGYGVRPF